MSSEIVGYLYEYLYCLILLLFLGAYWYTRYDIRHNHRKTTQQKKAQNPSVSKRWRTIDPDGIVLGKIGHNWYRIPERINGHGFDVGHCLVVGGSGTGKTSSVFAETLLANADNERNGKDFFRFCALDVKGELHKEFLPPVIAPENGESEYYLIDPTDKAMSYGWDTFGVLEGQLEDHDAIMRVSQEIASAYIQMDDKDKYFGPNAWTMLAGFIAWCVESKPRIEFVDMMQRLIQENCKDILQEVLDQAQIGSVTRQFLGRFDGKGDDSESLDDIVTTMTTALSCFGYESVTYMLRDNSYRISVNDIRDKSIVLVAPENSLNEQELSPVYRMILGCLMQYMMARIPDKGTLPTVFLLDELYTLGGGDKGYGLNGLGTFLSLARGYGAACVASVQSEKMLIKQYGREGGKIIEDNMHKVVLQATDPDTIKSVIQWTGKFDERCVSASEGKRVTTTVTWTRRDIFDSSDISSLVANGKVLIVPLTDQFSLINKSQWFKERLFKNIKKKMSE